MQTSPWQHNYRNRRNRRPTPEQEAREKAIREWAGEVMDRALRGEITPEQAWDLINQGPAKPNTVAG